MLAAGLASRVWRFTALRGAIAIAVDRGETTNVTMQLLSIVAHTSSSTLNGYVLRTSQTLRATVVTPCAGASSPSLLKIQKTPHLLPFWKDCK